jgi:hypothetical protein
MASPAGIDPYQNNFKITLFNVDPFLVGFNEEDYATIRDNQLQKPKWPTQKSYKYLFMGILLAYITAMSFALARHNTIRFYEKSNS